MFYLIINLLDMTLIKDNADTLSFVVYPNAYPDKWAIFIIIILIVISNVAVLILYHATLVALVIPVATWTSLGFGYVMFIKPYALSINIDKSARRLSIVKIITIVVPILHWSVSWKRDPYQLSIDNIKK